MANLYFDEALGECELAEGQVVTISGDEARHAVRVSRLRVGEQTIIGNGAGLLASGDTESVDRDSFTMRVASVERIEQRAPRLVLAQALAKGDRDERAVEQSTEFGVDAIIPWEAARSVSRWNDKAEKGLAKWARIAREASKQSMRGWIPEVQPVSNLDGLRKLAGEARVIVLHPRGEARLSEWASASALSADSDSTDICVVVGPEGGFSDAELDRFAEAGAEILVLGETVLRTSSAGPAAIAVLNAALGRW